MQPWLGAPQHLLSSSEQPGWAVWARGDSEEQIEPGQGGHPAPPARGIPAKGPPGMATLAWGGCGGWRKLQKLRVSVTRGGTGSGWGASNCVTCPSLSHRHRAQDTGARAQLAWPAESFLLILLLLL